MMFKIKRVLMTAVVLSFFAQPVFCALAADGQASRIVTLKSVEIKDGQGRWLKGVTSDKRVNLAFGRPVLSFFNNGRLPEGDLINFKITFSEGSGDSLSETSVCARNDFPPVLIRKNSFFSVRFWASPLIDEIKKLQLTLDTIAITLTDEDVLVETKGSQKWH